MGAPVKAARRMRWEVMKSKADTIDHICECIAAGAAIGRWCEEMDVPYRMVHAWLSVEPQLAQYNAAKRARAAHWVQEMGDAADKVANLEMRPDVARVVIDTKRWLASVHDRASYGDKIQVDAKVEHTHTLHLDALKAIRARVLEAQRIDSAPTSVTLYQLDEKAKDINDLQVVDGTVIPDASDL